MAYRQLNSISFALPIRQFEIGASVTVNETLPKVNEFVLRLIKVCGGATAEEIGKFFGFSGKEARLVLNALTDQSLIRMEGETVCLTEYAESKFYTDDDIPRFSVVKPRTDIIDFDLLTFHPIDGRRRKTSVGFLVEIPCETDRIGSSARLAEQAYQTHFKKILREKEKTKDDIDIYKISSVKSKKFFDIPIEVRFSLTSHHEVERVVEYDEDATEEFRLVVEAAISDVVQTSEPDQVVGLSEFSDYFDDAVLKRYFRQNGFDFELYVREVIDQKMVTYPDGTVPILGNIYMPENQELVIQKLSSVLDSSGSGVNLRSLVWLAPNYRLWGRTALLDDFYKKLENFLPQLKNPRKEATEHVYLLYPGIRETKWILERQLWSMPPKKIHFYSGDIMGGRAEVLLAPASFACVLFHFRPPGNSMALVPIGFMTTNIELIEKAKQLIGHATGYGSKYVGPANFDRTKQGRETPFAEQFAFLNYSSSHRKSANPVFGEQDSHKSRPRSSDPEGQNLQLPTSTKMHGVTAPRSGGNAADHQKLQPAPRIKRPTVEETDDQIIFRGGARGELRFKISKDQKWRGLMPLSSINARAVEDLAVRTGVDRRRLSKAMKNMAGYMKTLTPAEAATKLAAELRVPTAQIWRYFIDAMFIVER